MVQVLYLLEVFIYTTFIHRVYGRQNTNISTVTTRMVQLPATAAIEYVAACWVSGAGGIFVRGAYARSPKFNAYTNRLGFLCLAS